MVAIVSIIENTKTKNVFFIQKRENMKSSKNNKIHKKGLATIILIAFSIFFFIIYFFNGSIFYKSYLSVVSSCLENGEEIIKQKGYITAGQVEFIPVNSSTTNISITYIGKPSERTIRHEFIHLQQFQEGRLYSCKYPYLKYFNELEAYIKEGY